MLNQFNKLLLILWAMLFAKEVLFWLWLAQLKEYLWSRLTAHFETQTLKKIVSSAWRMKRPKLTKKTIVLLLTCFFIETMIGFWAVSISGVAFYGLLLGTFVLSPIFVLLVVVCFQVLTWAIKKLVILKATKKIKIFKDLIVIGITGSFGKTSTKEFLSVMLSGKFNILNTEKHTNAEIAIAKIILKNLKPEHQVFIAEIGAYNKKAIQDACNMLKPKIGILTGINSQHLSTFGSQEKIIAAKFKLIETLPSGGVAILNGDNAFVISNYMVAKNNNKLSDNRARSALSQIANLNKKTKYIVCATKTGADVMATDIKVEKENLVFKVLTKASESCDFRVNVLGQQNIINILMAIACCLEMGMGLPEISQTCLKIKPENGSLQVKKSQNGFNIIDSTYSANPDGVLADLDYLSLYEGKKILVMPCLIELGEVSKAIHEKLGRKIGEVCDLAIICSQDRFNEIKQGASNGKAEVLLIENPSDIFQKIAEFAKPNDTILLESRVPKVLLQAL